ncbi:MAG: DNA cytosine methyltransferase [Acidobacteriia bacterium]|nr:DNA cytosine methyltransferase [Terriglobia bacterium]
MTKIVDLFCGCGGFGLGAKQAGFEVTIAVDIDTTLQSAYKCNFPNTRVETGDLSSMTEADWTLLLQGNNIDGVIGGPPCQGYSRIGKGNIDDPRRSLIRHFFRTVNIISPKFFVMENVEGLLDNKNAQELFDAISMADKKYTVLPPIVVDASKFGAPTKRKRVVVIGFDPLALETITPSEILDISKAPTTVHDAISDIGEPVAQQKDKNNLGWGQYRENTRPSEYAKIMRSQPIKGLGSDVALDLLAKGFVSGNFDTTHLPEVRARYGSIQPGQIDPVSRAKKLSWEGICPTLRAGTGADKGSHQAVRPIHPTAPRVITVREAARLQGFPDWYCFHNTKWHSFRMIGNSVSPLVSEGILKLIYRKLTRSPSLAKS